MFFFLIYVLKVIFSKLADVAQRLIIWNVPLLSLNWTFKMPYKINVNWCNDDKYQV